MFEVHITCLLKDAEFCEKAAKALHWKFSAIAGDPVLGKDTYCYLTTHGTDLLRTVNRMSAVVADLKKEGVQVIREKIEVIIHDVRY